MSRRRSEIIKPGRPPAQIAVSALLLAARSGGKVMTPGRPKAATQVHAGD
jgi:hypothetical protein